MAKPLKFIPGPQAVQQRPKEMLPTCAVATELFLA